MTVNLPNTISEDEELARVVCASSKAKKYEKTAFYLNEEKKYVVNVLVFLSHNNPIELSVNRISTITYQESHELGKQHQRDNQKTSTYHGFAKVKAKLCFDKGCKVQKDDIGGTKPYHANIIYPYSQTKEDNQEIAVELAHHAEFIKHDDAQLN